MKAPTRQQAIRRRRCVLGIGAGGVVLAAALTSAFGWPGFADPDPSARLADTSAVSPLLTPTTTPAARVAEQTDLTLAMPDVVGGYVQTNIAGSASWPGGDSAIESWRFTYSDGDTDSVKSGAANTVAVDVGQWEDPVDAQDFYYARIKPLAKPIAHGVVYVGEEKVGKYALISDSAEQATLYWRNGTLVLRAQGPLDQLRQFYSNFPL